MNKMMFNDNYDLETGVLLGWKTSTMRKIPKRILPSDIDKCLAGSSALSWLLSPYQFKQHVAVAQSYYQIYLQMSINSGFTKLDVANFYINFYNTEGWNNKMFVAADYMLHFIEMDAIRMMHVQDADDELCLKEGIQFDTFKQLFYYSKKVFNRLGVMHQVKTYFESPREAFKNLLDEINGFGYWNANPLVFQYNFHLLK